MVTVDTDVGPLRAWDHDDVTRGLQQTGTWDAHLHAAIDGTPDRTTGLALDLGANIGYFTRYCAARFGAVVAIEAHPATFVLLAYNVQDCPTVWPIRGAAYDHRAWLEPASCAVHGWPEGEQSLADPDRVPHMAGMSFVETPHHQHADHQWRVGTVVVDQLPLSAPVRLIKVDVQGAALRALHGCRAIIDRDRPRILFEYEGHVSQVRGDDWLDYEACFRAWGYTLTQLEGPWVEYLAEPIGA